MVQFNVFPSLSEVELPFVVNFKAMDESVVVVDEAHVRVVCERSCVVVYDCL